MQKSMQKRSPLKSTKCYKNLWFFSDFAPQKGAQNDPRGLPKVVQKRDFFLLKLLKRLGNMCKSHNREKREFEKKNKIRKVPNRNFEFRLGNINKFTYAALCNVNRHFDGEKIT